MLLAYRASETAARLVWPFGDRGLRKRLHRITCPTLLLWGLRDFVFDADYLEEWQRRMPHARTHTYERAGHYILEDARDDVLALVQTFVAEAPMAKPS